MTQVFCIRRETTIDMAALVRQGDTITLFDIYLKAGDELKNFPSDLSQLIEKHCVNTVWVNSPDEGEGSLRDLAEFRVLSKGVSLRPMKRFVKAISGRIARANLLNKGNLDESGCDQSAKLANRISRLSERGEAPADIQAYLCGLELVEDYEAWLEPEDGSLLGSFANPTPDDYFGGGGMSRTADWLRMR